MIHHERARLSKNLMPNIVGCANSEPRISGRRMNVNLFESRGVEDLPVSYTIKRDSTREAHRFQSGSLCKLFQHAQIDFLKPCLQRRRQILVPLLERLLGIAFGTQ